MNQLNIPTKALQKALAKSALLPEVNTSDGISHLVHVFGHEGKTILRRNSIGGQMTVTMEGETALDFWLPFERFRKTVEALNGEDATITLTGGAILIRSGKSNLKLALLPPEGSREVAPLVNPQGFTMPAEVFADHLSAVQTAFCTTATNRPMIEGMLFQPHKGNTYLVGMDGRRAHCIEVARGVALEAFVPKRATSAIYGLCGLAEKKDDILFGYNGNWLDVSVGDAHFLTPTLEGSVPNVMDMYAPETTEAVISCERKEMLDACKAAECLEATYVELSVEKDSISITSVSGMDHFERTISGKMGQPHKFKLNAKYLGDILRGLRGDFVTLRTEDGDFVSHFIEADRLCIVMNIRIVEPKKQP